MDIHRVIEDIEVFHGFSMFWLIENLLSTLDSGARGVGYQGNVLVARGWQSQKFWVVF